MKSGSHELRVGLFVMAALIVGGSIVFIIGNRSAMFEAKVRYYAVFESVDGLRGGSPVRIAGIDVGTVSDVTFDVESGNIRVSLDIRRDLARFVRGPTDAEADDGSQARVGSKGLLGDQLVDISVGHGERLAAESTIPAARDSTLTTFLGETGRQAEGIVANLQRATEGFADPQLGRDVRSLAHNLEALTRLAYEGEGTVHRLLTDPRLADDVQTSVRAIRDTSVGLARTMTSVRRIVAEVEAGDGTAHELLYGDGGTRLVQNLADTAGEAATILRDVRSGDNNAHTLLYGQGAGNLVENLTAVSRDLRVVMGDIRAGRGTVGGLLVDPSIYEDVKRLVGNLQRNEILRSLVRYSIREDAPRPRPPRPAPADAR